MPLEGVELRWELELVGRVVHTIDVIRTSLDKVGVTQPADGAGWLVAGLPQTPQFSGMSLSVFIGRSPARSLPRVAQTLDRVGHVMVAPPDIIALASISSLGLEAILYPHGIDRVLKPPERTRCDLGDGEREHVTPCPSCAHAPCPRLPDSLVPPG